MDSESLHTDSPTLRALGMRSVVVTPGARGALMSMGIDSLAAGLTACETLLEAARPAVRFGGFAVQSAGTRPSCPTIFDVLRETAPNGVSTTTGVTA